MTETLQNLINEANAKGWDWETFESTDDQIVFQMWPHPMTMYEYIFDSTEGFAVAGYLTVVGYAPEKLF